MKGRRTLAALALLMVPLMGLHALSAEGSLFYRGSDDIGREREVCTFELKALVVDQSPERLKLATAAAENVEGI